MTTVEHRAQLNRALNDIDLRIHSKLDADAIMQSALDGFVDALGADAGDIKLTDGDEWVVRYEHGFGSQEVGLRLAAGNAPVAVRAAALREPITITDYAEEPEDFYVGFPRAHGLRATLAVPLIVREEVIGCLFAWMRGGPRAFTDAEVDFARRMATSLGLALANARLLETTRLLLDAAEQLTTTVAPDEIATRLASIVLRATGLGRVFINLVDTKRRTLTPVFASGGLRAPGGAVIEFERLSETARGAIDQAQTAVLDYERPDVPDADRAIAQANRARLVLFVPLVHHGEMVGHISLDEPDARATFTPESIRIVESIAAQAAVALENARLFEREHRIAELLQEAVIAPPAAIDTLDVGALYQPAAAASDIGGDFYEVLELDDGRVALMVGDVSGKGIEAARHTTLLRDGANAFLLEGSGPAETLDRLNRLAYRLTPPDRFATTFLGVLDPASGELRYASAGHTPALIAGGDVRALESTGSLLGAFPDVRFAEERGSLGAGEVLVLYTDGVTEARFDGELYGTGRLAETLTRRRDTPAESLPAAILDDVLTFAHGVLRDDVVILCVGRKADETPA